MALTRLKVPESVNPLLIPPPGALELHYPSDDDEPIAYTEAQFHAIVDSVFVIQRHLARAGRAATVRGKCALYYDPGRLTAYITPDVLLAHAVNLPGNEGYAPWVHGKTPDLVMEMASPTTYMQDVGPKKARYAEMGIPEYWQYDPHHEYLERDLMGWRLKSGKYEAISLRHDAERGAHVAVSQVLDAEWGLDLATGSLRLWNEASQDWYLTGREEAAARGREAARADRETARANREAARANREAAEAERLRERIRELEAGAD